MYRENVVQLGKNVLISFKIAQCCVTKDSISVDFVKLGSKQFSILKREVFCFVMPSFYSPYSSTLTTVPILKAPPRRTFAFKASAIVYQLTNITKIIDIRRS